jgi:hypothetical protein
MMSEDRKMSRAEVKAIIEEIWGPPPKPKPKVVTTEAGVVRNANVRVSPSDPNYAASDNGVVKVRRSSDFVTIRMDLYEEQMRLKREDRLRRKALDPARLGIWGPTDEDD